MKTREELVETLDRVDGKGYKAYKDIEGEYDMGGFLLYIDHVQSDPFAPPSRLRVRVAQTFPPDYTADRDSVVALSDYLTRQFSKSINKYNTRGRGTGRSFLISIDCGRQEILERTSMHIAQEYVEARFEVGLPAAGRRILGREAVKIFTETIPSIVKNSLFFGSIDWKEAVDFIDLYQDQQYIRRVLRNMGLVAFVADGAVLPRESGISERPLKNAVPFRSPDTMRVSIMLPHRGTITGMGIPEGVTLVVGGGYHGKSTLLKALEKCVYNHIPGDGREYVITVDDAVKIRAEDGRYIENVDISPFINNIPTGEDTRFFSTLNASGSTSQAANIIEALEIGTSLLLMDEDTCATNFMIRDARMQRLVSAEKEPITPFLDSVRALYENKGVSTVLVLGGAGDYFDVCDRVIMMDGFVPHDVTVRAKEIAEEIRSFRERDKAPDFTCIKERVPMKRSLNAGYKDKIQSKGLENIRMGYETVDLSMVEQIADDSQTAAIANIIRYARDRYIDDRATLREVIDRVLTDIDENSLSCISPFKGHPGNMARPRRYEIAAAFNRYRGFKTVR
ncbi:ABC-ATPase domain-containing protein [Calorimonas adulescens]|jgi:Predicted ATPase of the ABC class.|uniref:ABC-ATPase domain-containing protein n=1 Tax=Calorimonas adulescens TaxID=2606906 RepID=A0A5D8Q8E5_9THEO|nr:ABC-ATPase domain-containing protein [Calorimonas adulescens]TZE80910.1 ABC-ATPase domain-containing protein [Calorimonas adulescens]